MTFCDGMPTVVLRRKVTSDSPSSSKRFEKSIYRRVRYLSVASSSGGQTSEIGKLL